MISDQEAEEIKNKIISHIEKTFPEEQKYSAINQIESMNSEQLENFLKKNNMIKNDSGEDQETEKGNECVFCAIASDKIHSVKIDENEDAVAVLEINPVSYGHALIVPKKHSETASKKAMSLAEKISKKIKEKLKAKKVEISKTKLFGHEIINVIPVYEDENISSKRKPVEVEELEKIKKEIEKPEEIKEEPKRIIETLWLPKRIP